MIATTNLRFDVVKYLLANMDEEQIDIQNQDGFSALDYARETNNEDMIDLIMTYGDNGEESPMIAELDAA